MNVLILIKVLFSLIGHLFLDISVLISYVRNKRRKNYADTSTFLLVSKVHEILPRDQDIGGVIFPLSEEVFFMDF